jgi:GTP-sensing pleiotropic transcriptional regulator CodY
MTAAPQTRCFREGLARVRAIFSETTGVRMTTVAVADVAGLDRQVCRVMLRTLTETGFLEQRPMGVFIRRQTDPNQSDDSDAKPA